MLTLISTPSSMAPRALRLTLSSRRRLLMNKRSTILTPSAFHNRVTLPTSSCLTDIRLLLRPLQRNQAISNNSSTSIINSNTSSSRCHLPVRIHRVHPRANSSGNNILIHHTSTNISSHHLRSQSRRVISRRPPRTLSRSRRLSPWFLPLSSLVIAFRPLVYLPQIKVWVHVITRFRRYAQL